jgi:hypothetical protein
VRKAHICYISIDDEAELLREERATGMTVGELCSLAVEELADRSCGLNEPLESVPGGRGVESLGAASRTPSA